MRRKEAEVAMSDNMQMIDILSARLDTLESEVLAGASADSAGNDWSAADANGNPSVKDVDPKGRKIWEAQWSEKEKSLLCYVPNCALIVNGEEVSVEPEDKNARIGEEIRLSKGEWFLQVFEFGNSNGFTARFTAEPKLDDENLKYTIKIISVTEYGTVENQFVVGTVVLTTDGKKTSTPFECVISMTTGAEGQKKASAYLVNCRFYWEGKLRSLVDYDASDLLNSGGTIYLSGKQEQASEMSPTPDWTWSINTEEADAPNNGKVLNFKLYDFSGGRVSVDYRTTFLTMWDTTKKARIEVGRTEKHTGISLDASGDGSKIEVLANGEDRSKGIFIDASTGKLKLVVTDGKHSIELDIAQFGADCLQPSMGIRKITWFTEGEGGVPVPAFAHVIACSDIDIPMLGVESDGGGGGGGGGGGEETEITIEKGEDTNLWVNGSENGAVGEKFKIDVYYS